MRLLFEIDKKDYEPEAKAYVRPSSRAIIIRNGKIAMVHSLLYDCYKFPGGGIEQGETLIDAVIRETAEEAGLTLIRDTIREYGYVHRVQRHENGDAGIFVQDNCYFLGEAEEAISEQVLDDYESRERFTLEFVDPREAIHRNLDFPHGTKDTNTMIREAGVLKLLIEEGYFDKQED